jgi:cell division protein FtsW
MMSSFLRPLNVLREPQRLRSIDWNLLLIVTSLISLGLVFVASASVTFAEASYGDGWFFVKRYSVFMVMGILAGLIIAAIPVSIWEQYGGLLLVVTLVLLVAVLIPGVGRKVNGSQRWLQLGTMTFQASEAVKFCMIIFFSSFLARKQFELQQDWRGLLKPLLVLSVVIFLLLLEPDFGTSVVLAGTVMGMLFIAGAKMWQFIILFIGSLMSLGALAYFSPYRLQRLVSFRNPWADQYDSGYQLTQSLIAFGRGEWLGLGLGNSVQKLFYLPEAHTDFIVAIIAEEMGLIGLLVLLVLFSLLIGKILLLSHQALSQGSMFIGYSAFGIAIMLAGQAFINIGVASGLLPTKGLTLPFISYGGSSLLVCCSMMGLVLRMGCELKQVKLVQKSVPSPKKQRSFDEASMSLARPGGVS